MARSASRTSGSEASGAVSLKSCNEAATFRLAFGPGPEWRTPLASEEEEEEAAEADEGDLESERVCDGRIMLAELSRAVIREEETVRARVVFLLGARFRGEALSSRLCLVSVAEPSESDI
jgi:hypothetical protein